MSGDGRQLAAAAFSPDGRRFAAGGRDGVTRVWSVDGGPPVAELRGQRCRVSTTSGFAPASDRVVSAGDDGAVRIWDAGRTRSWTLPSLTYDLDFNRDGRSSSRAAATTGRCGSGIPATGALRSSLDGPAGFTYGTFSPTDDTARDRERSIGPGSGRSPRTPPRMRRPAPGRPVDGRSVVFDPTGKRIVYADPSRQGGRARPRLRARGAARRPPGARSRRRVQPPTAGTSPSITDRARPHLGPGASRPRRSTSSKGHTGPVNALDFSPDGRILTAGSDRTVRIWDTDGRQLVVMRGHEDELTTAVFTADGTKVLSASKDGSLRLLDARSGAALARSSSPVRASSTTSRVSRGRDRSPRSARARSCGSSSARSAEISTDVRALALSRSPRQLTPAERRAVPRRRRADDRQRASSATRCSRTASWPRRTARSRRPRAHRPSTASMSPARVKSPVRKRASSDCGPLPRPTGASRATQTTSRLPNGADGSGCRVSGRCRRSGTATIA